MTISFNNYAKKIGSREIKGSKQDWFRFQVFVEEDDELENIEYVEYELHPSIPNPYRPVADRSTKFAIKFNSWGIFTVRMTVKFKDGSEKTDQLLLKEDNPFPGEGAPLSTSLKNAFVLKTTSFFKKDRQEEYWKKNPSLKGMKLYNIYAIVDSSIEGALEKIDRVEYFLPAHPEGHKNQVKTDSMDKFLLKELAHGDFMLTATIFLKGNEEPIELRKHIERQEAGSSLLEDNWEA